MKKLYLPKVKSALEHRFVMCVQFLIDKDCNLFFFSNSATSEKPPWLDENCKLAVRLTDAVSLVAVSTLIIVQL